MNRLIVTILGVLLFAIATRAADEPAVDAPRMSGTLSFTCTPDAKSKTAGAAPFDDTLELGDDRVKSKALAGQGFPVALSIPKIVNGVTTINASFKKQGDTATYFLRIKSDKQITGSFVRMTGTKTLRYTIGGGSSRGEPENPNPSKTTGDALLDPDVLRVNGGFVRLMSAQVAMADAGVSAEKTKVAEIIKSAGADQNTMRMSLIKGEMTPAQYVHKAEARLAAAHDAVAKVLGDNAAKVEKAYDAPFAGGYVKLNQMRAAVADSGAPADASKRADQVIYHSLLDLTMLAKKRGELTADAAHKLEDRTHTDVLSALGADHRERFDKVFTGLSSQGGNTSATTKPAKPAKP